MFDMKKIGKTLSSLRKKCGMTQMGLARRLGISFQAVSHWERGESMPDISNLTELATVFGCSVDTILGVEQSEAVDEAVNDVAETANEQVNEKALTAPDTKVLVYGSEETPDEYKGKTMTEHEDESDLAELAIRAYNEDKVSIFALLVDTLDKETCKELAIRAYSDGNEDVLETLIDYIDVGTRKALLHRAFEDNNEDMFELLKWF